MDKQQKQEFLSDYCYGLDGLYPEWTPTQGQQAQWMDCLERKDFARAVKAIRETYSRNTSFNKKDPDIALFNQIYAGFTPQGRTSAKRAMTTDTFIQYHGGGHCLMKPGYMVPVHCFLDNDRTRTEAFNQTRDMLAYQNGGDWRVVTPTTHREMARQRHKLGGYPEVAGTYREIIKKLSEQSKG